MYSSPADVRNALTPGADETDETTAANLSDAQLEDAIQEADADIDTYILSRYSVPQDATNPDVAVFPVRSWSRDIAAYLATLTFRKSKDMTADDPVRLRYDRVMSILNDVANGTLQPNLPQPTTPPDGYGPQGAFVYNQYPHKLFHLSDVFAPPSPLWTSIPLYRYGDLERAAEAQAYWESP